MTPSEARPSVLGSGTLLGAWAHPADEAYPSVGSMAATREAAGEHEHHLLGRASFRERWATEWFVASPRTADPDRDRAAAIAAGSTSARA